MGYTVRLSESARKSLNKLPRSLADRIRERIDHLSENPRPTGVKKLAKEENHWRIRVGDYRVIYEIHDDNLFVLIVKIAHRREAYR